MDYTPQETTDTQSGAPVKEKVSLKDRLRKWVAERSRKKNDMDMEELPDFADTVQPAMERLTDDLIEQTVGPDGALLQAFREQISQYDPEKNPISPREARALLNGLLDLAASRRKLLNERLERSVEVGSLYTSYYGRVQAVDQLAIRAYTAMEHMDLAEEDFRFQYALYPKVRKTAVIDEMVPEEEDMKMADKIRARMNARKKDIMEALDEMGGVDS